MLPGCLAAQVAAGKRGFLLVFEAAQRHPPSAKLADAAFAEQRYTSSPDVQGVGGVKITPAHELQPCGQSLDPAHLHLHAEGAELTGQRLQNVLRRLWSCSQGWSEGGGGSFHVNFKALPAAAPPGGGGSEAHARLPAQVFVYLLELMCGGMDRRRLDGRLLL